MVCALSSRLALHGGEGAVVKQQVGRRAPAIVRVWCRIGAWTKESRCPQHICIALVRTYKRFLRTFAYTSCTDISLSFLPPIRSLQAR